MHVMAGVLIDSRGRVLLAQRPPGKHLAGLWEFPGGKREPDESPGEALTRELREELDIQADAGEPLIRIPWRYGERTLLLDAWMIRRWHGEPASMEGQALQWLSPSGIDLSQLAPADRPILRALQLPSRYAITPADAGPETFDAWRQRVGAALVAGQRLVLLRFPQWPLEQVRELAGQLLSQAREHGAQLLLSGDVEGAARLGMGVQLKARQLKELDERPLPLGQWIGASCHDAGELALAAALADFATLSPVAPTASHPGDPALGWTTFAQLAEAASLPVYALGGMHLDDALAAQHAGGQGVAGIRGFW